MSSETQPARNSTSLRSIWALGLVLALVLGIGFRLAWPNDIEYKLDEFYTFAKTKKFLSGAGANAMDNGSPWLGMSTSKGFKNTGMSLWIFYAIGAVSGTGSPPALARGVQACGIAAILLMVVFALRCLKDREREWWLWTAAMVCVNPFAVLFERKIWPPSPLPLLMVLYLISWRSRSTRWGAFCWGLLGLLAGQIHMAGFFYVAAFFLWTVAYDRRRAAWPWWIAGNLLGVIPMLPWIFYMLHGRDHSAEYAGAPLVAWQRLFGNHFWVDWVTEPFGLGLGYSLGNDFGAFATWGVKLLLAVATLLSLRIFLGGLFRLWKNRGKWLQTWKDDHALFTTSVLQAGFWFFGILLTISCIRFERHYLITAFPLAILWVARLALPIRAGGRQWSAGRRILLALCVTNALITFAFLHFIHVNGGAPGGDYGKSYAKQMQSPAFGDPATINP